MSTKWTFKRSISAEMIEAMNSAYSGEEMGWIRQYMDDPELFLAIRDNSINFYYRGNSVLQLTLDGGRLNGRVHYKYLLRPFLKTEGKKDQPYVGSHEKVVLPVINPIEENASKWIKAASKPYSGVEKEGVHKIISANQNIVDVELSFSRETDDGAVDGSKQNRIDFCALRGNDSGLELCFYEAKHFSNKELRAQGEPPVVRQINRYNQTISSHKKEIHSAYEIAFKQILKLGNQHPASEYMSRALSEGFSISDDVRLVVFGFDQSQKDGFDKNKTHLVDHGIKKKFLLMKGDSKDFRKGISK